jgi:hypothetical protein
MERPWELPVSTTVGDAYRLVRRMGEGAQGAVFEARMPFDGDRRCALKIMNGALTESAEALAAFQSQAEGASRIAHPHLVRLLDFGTDGNGQCFLVMEYLEGEDLARRLARMGRLPPPVVSFLIEQIGQGLTALHDQGAAHLDLKPANVFLQPHEGGRDFVKLLDFGTARIDNARNLSHPTALEDTLPYVAPEQASGRTEPLDHRTDQWALACVAWQLLFGRTPFAGAHAPDPTTLLFHIVYEDPVPVADVAGDVPAGVMTVLRRALEKRPDDRFPDIISFVKAFEAMAGTLPPLPRQRPEPMPPAPSRPGAPAVWPQAAAAEPVFLPGMSRREAAPAPRTPSARKARRQGLRVPPISMQMSGAAVAPAMAPGVAFAAAAGMVDHPGPDSPARSGGPNLIGASWAGLSGAGSSRRIWLLGAAAAVLVGALVGRDLLHRRRVVDVDRAAPTTEGAAVPPSPAPGEGPLIVPLNSPPPTTTAAVLKGRHRRQRGQGLRAQPANVQPKAHKAEGGTRTRRGKSSKR